MTNSLTRAALAAFLLVPATAAGAQITTVIAPPRRTEVQRADSVRRVEAARDSVARVTLTDMKAWVDSAASALAVRPDTARPAADSAAVAATPADSVARPDTAADTPRTRAERSAPGGFPEAQPAPDTATPIPALAVTGGLLLVVGGLLLRRRTVSAKK